jgi:ankyrin repeat protein
MKKNHTWLKVFLSAASILSMIDQGVSMEPVDINLPINRELFEVALSGDRARAESLIEHGADVRIIDDLYTTIWYRAIWSGDTNRAIDSFGKILLYKAIQSGDVARVNFLVNRRIDANAIYPGMETALHRAVGSENTAMVSCLLTSHANIEAFDSYGRTAFLCAALFENIDIIRRLVSSHANVNAIDFRGCTAAHYAATLEKPDILMYLVMNCGVNVKILDVEGISSLHYAIGYGQPGTVKFLAPFFKDRINIPYLEGETFLTFAIKRMPLEKEESVEAFECLCCTGADVNMANGQGEFPLHIAVSAYPGIVDLFKLFMSFGADLNKVDEDKQTLLHRAAGSGNIDLARFLLDNGLDINAIDGFGRTPAHIAADLEKPDMLLYLAVNRGANIRTAIIPEWITPLHCAIGTGSIDSVKFLAPFFKGLINKPTPAKETFLTFAVKWMPLEKEESVEKLKHLHRMGADFNWFALSDGKIEPPLHIAISRLLDDWNPAKMAAIECLIDCGADINAYKHDSNAGGGRGQSPLGIAIGARNQLLLACLLNRGADVNHLSHDGKSPLHLAIEANDFCLVESLLTHRANANIICHGESPLDLALRLREERGDNSLSSLDIIRLIGQEGGQIYSNANTSRYANAWF